MFYRAMVLTNAVLGLLGIGLSYLQHRRNRVYFWLMFGSGVLLVVPLVQYFFGRLAMLCGYRVYTGYQAFTLMPTAYLSSWGRWVAYALLFGGMLNLVRHRLEPVMTEDMMQAVAEFKASTGASAVLGMTLPEPSTQRPSKRVEFRDMSGLPAGSLEELLKARSVGPPIGGTAATSQWQDELHRIEHDVDRRTLREGGTFVTYLDDIPIGYGSHHLTESPTLGVVGYNCIMGLLKKGLLVPRWLDGQKVASASDATAAVGTAVCASGCNLAPKWGFSTAPSCPSSGVVGTAGCNSWRSCADWKPAGRKGLRQPRASTRSFSPRAGCTSRVASRNPGPVQPAMAISLLTIAELPGVQSSVVLAPTLCRNAGRSNPQEAMHEGIQDDNHVRVTCR